MGLIRGKALMFVAGLVMIINGLTIFTGLLDDYTRWPLMAVWSAAFILLLVLGTADMVLDQRERRS